MSDMNISDEAIEAAAMAILAVNAETWALQTTHVKDRYRWDAQAALQAALPYLTGDVMDSSAAGGPHGG